MAVQDWEGDCRCDHCGKNTPHRYHDDGHERDSSHDWRQCLVCGWKAWGFTGEYQPDTLDEGK
jgi:hypothetical protein